ncbi:MAG: hypothetical protein L3J79_01080, partial [Candidatus Marinimicrobia bacterium]|nr:hypothetical protein [Candidatus Neomarinimicrobiota bacterium]
PKEITIDPGSFSLKGRDKVMVLPRPKLINRTKAGKTPRLIPFGNVTRKSKSLVFVPLFWEWLQIGVFSLQSYTENKFTASDIDKLKIFANQIGGALVRAQTDHELLLQTHELKIRERDLEASIDEKNVLLKEIYHRTKNNMQVIVGLLEMHGYKTKDSETSNVLTEMIDRIISMSMVHDLLYRSKNLTEIKLDIYLEKLISRLLVAYQTSTGEISLNFKAEAIPVNIQFAIPLGLVINEIVSNALKHAFPGNRDGQITVSAKAWNGNGLDLLIRDDGVDLKQGFDLDLSTSMGVRIIQDIVRLQLFGEITSRSVNGLEYRIKIPRLELN